jgi:hypothetical protein
MCVNGGQAAAHGNSHEQHDCQDSGIVSTSRALLHHCAQCLKAFAIMDHDLSGGVAPISLPDRVGCLGEGDDKLKHSHMFQSKGEISSRQRQAVCWFQPFLFGVDMDRGIVLEDCIASG